MTTKMTRRAALGALAASTLAGTALAVTPATLVTPATDDEIFALYRGRARTTNPEAIAKLEYALFMARPRTLEGLAVKTALFDDMRALNSRKINYLLMMSVAADAARLSSVVQEDLPPPPLTHAEYVAKWRAHIASTQGGVL